MKILIKAHAITAILGWILVVVMAVIVIKEEGSLPAVASLCLTGVATGITIVDLLSVFLKKQPVLPAISVVFWGMVLLLYSWGIFSPNQDWQGRVVFGALILIAFIKIMASVSIIKMRQSA